MRILIAEDDQISSKILYKLLSEYGECDITVDGLEIIDAYLMAWEEGEPYELLCVDIMMPKLDGIKALKTIRNIEKKQKVKKEQQVRVMVVSALNDQKTIKNAYDAGCDLYLGKPVDMDKLDTALKSIGIYKKS